VSALTTPRECPAYWTAEFFPSTPVHHNFRHETGANGWGNNEAQNYTNSPENSFHTPDSSLTIRAIANNGVYTSARLTSHQLLARPRGYVTATVVAPSAKGIWPAFWLLPADPFTWPGDGEIDIFEAWDAGLVNHSCLHWGHYNGEDWNKHRVIETPLPELRDRPHTFGLAWSEEGGIPGWRGRLMWYVDGRPVMKAQIPPGMRRMEDFRVLLNVAMGGKVNGGKLPDNGVYDFVVRELKMCDDPPGGWGVFEGGWGSVPEGKTM
jgi:beta-glucanase (GH16 family)